LGSEVGGGGTLHKGNLRLGALSASSPETPIPLSVTYNAIPVAIIFELHLAGCHHHTNRPLLQPCNRETGSLVGQFWFNGSAVARKIPAFPSKIIKYKKNSRAEYWFLTDLSVNLIRVKSSDGSMHGN